MMADGCLGEIKRPLHQVVTLMQKVHEDRRKDPRFKTKGGAFVDLHKPRYIHIGKPKLVKLGPIIDISKGGICASYDFDDIRPINSKRLTLSIPDYGLQVQGIPYKTISDKYTDDPSTPKNKGLCRLEFGRLNKRQKYLIDKFIQFSMAGWGW